MRVLFRSDSSSSIGLGHVMRDLVLAENYQNDEVFFACQNLEGNINESIPYPVHILNSNAPEELITLIKSLHVDLLIIDHYDIDYKTEKIIKEKTAVKLCCFDDQYKEHFCDEIINHNISADKNKYKNPQIVKIIPPLIREEFKKEKNIQREKIYDVLVAMGGADTTNINISILKCLPDSLHVSVLTTSANSNLDALKKYVTCRDNISLHVNSNEVAKLINQSKQAIVTPSVMVHEILFMDIPFVAIKTASNQDDIYTYLKQNNYSTMPKWDEQEFKKCLKI
ncbi:UDP-2,4-diacetamido-2,4,6-trideoxy-beta-L-altropyranose hydrolase [Sulfurospirillum arcachonense]|uniref:UDP-2,4-diacetamido-2,4, 6-trideoxy-beta-L-altropyranose hydrolase n=1 Tax=Sulfurospirillum arcachonense TaxID=57666 RepID=UPI0004683583|nr:UDP-2,4-diacetamido-2,4,6-trideoxy-beta-L-altropyranose hydrolase [Sulfurospirillum arcachonense]